MKLFYLTALDELDREKCGILGKIKGQINSFEHRGIDVHFGHFHSKNNFVVENRNGNSVIDVNGRNTRDRLASVYDNIYSYIENNSITAIYIRFTSLDGRAIKFYRKLAQKNVRVIIEFYSHNLELEARKTVKRNFKNKKYINGLKGNLSLIINKRYFSKLHTCVDLIVTTTEVGELYGIPTINVVNGIDTTSVAVRTRSSNEYDFNIISVAMISSWHGYDRVIKGIAEYYEQGGTANILYTVIGDGEEKPKLEKMVEDLKLRDHVIFTGIKLAEELTPYYNQADVALEMLAGFRRTKGQISSIKMAEYFAKGIPVVYAADKELYTGAMKKYCYRVSNDDSSVDIKDLLSYCREIYRNNKNVEESMHQMAKQYFDWDVTMERLHKYMIEKCNYESSEEY